MCARRECQSTLEARVLAGLVALADQQRARARRIDLEEVHWCPGPRCAGEIALWIACIENSPLTPDISPSHELVCEVSTQNVCLLDIYLFWVSIRFAALPR